MAVTFPKPGSGVETDIVDRESLSMGFAAVAPRERRIASRRLAKVGYPLKGMEVAVQSSDGHDLSDREVGRIVIRGTSLIPGYLKEPPGLDADWFDTGDLGYMVDGQLVVCGRSKDVMIVAGRNIYPEEVEQALAELEGVSRRNVAVFSSSDSGHESIAVVAEADDPDDYRLVRRIEAMALDWCGVRTADVILIRPGTIAKTPSGKISRSGCRDAYQIDNPN